MVSLLNLTHITLSAGREQPLTIGLDNLLRLLHNRDRLTPKGGDRQAGLRIFKK